MKLSLRWIVEHIEIDSAAVDISYLLNEVTRKVTEIESITPLSLDLASISLAGVIACQKDNIELQCLEKNRFFMLPMRPDAKIGEAFFVAHAKVPRWATMHDFGSSKETLMPALQPDPQWRALVNQDDTILTISNTCITHRPDLWSHRGFAREIAALLEVPLRSEKNLLASLAIKRLEDLTYDGSDFAWHLTNKVPNLCSHLGVVSLQNAPNQPSSIRMALQLASIDARPISWFVDLTNYVMFDWGQPLHAFDADTFTSSKFSIATNQESDASLQLLDGSTITLPPQALIVQDDTRPISLAGIMGGSQSGISSSTKNILLEGAHFAPTAIRKSSTLLHLRSEASARFEKDLDAAQIPQALQRFIFLAQKNFSGAEKLSPLIFLGPPAPERFIEITHHHIEKLLGIKLEVAYIKNSLEARGFGVTLAPNGYLIRIPSWRLKDCVQPEDMVEEIGRFYGWDNLPHRMPSLPLAPHSLEFQNRLDNLKNYIAFSGRSHEVLNYPVFEEDFLEKLKWRPSPEVRILNPVSQTAASLVSSLMPNLIKNVVENNGTYEKKMSFFEVNPVWERHPSQQPKEVLSCAGIWYNAAFEDNFYYYKDLLSNLFLLLQLQVSWTKPESRLLPPWYHPFKTATLIAQGVVVGYAGILNPSFAAAILDGSAFIFELNLDLLLLLPSPVRVFTPLTKYPDTWLDISMLAPLAMSVKELEESIKKVDERIFNVLLVDLFTKKEWGDKRSVSVRLFARDPHQTLTKESIETLQARVHTALKSKGVEIR